MNLMLNQSLSEIYLILVKISWINNKMKLTLFPTRKLPIMVAILFGIILISIQILTWKQLLAKISVEHLLILKKKSLIVMRYVVQQQFVVLRRYFEPNEKSPTRWKIVFFSTIDDHYVTLLYMDIRIVWNKNTLIIFAESFERDQGQNHSKVVRSF